MSMTVAMLKKTLENVPDDCLVYVEWIHKTWTGISNIESTRIDELNREIVFETGSGD